VADSPVTLDDLTGLLERPVREIEEALHQLGSRYDANGPIQVVRLAGGYQLATKPAYSRLVASFLKPQKKKLSQSMLEVLAIVAYQQPITSAEIDAVRGVQSDYGLSSLIERRLVKEVGRKATPGRPILYGTTQHFLHQFNLNSLEELPELQVDQQALPGFELETLGETPSDPEEKTGPRAVVVTSESS